jgi:hypothetical protein
MRLAIVSGAQHVKRTAEEMKVEAMFPAIARYIGGCG